MKQNVRSYLLQSGYKMYSLKETRGFISQNGHLAKIHKPHRYRPCAEEVAENGADLGEMNKIGLMKIEENLSRTCFGMTLHLIRLEKEVEALKTSK